MVYDSFFSRLRLADRAVRCFFCPLLAGGFEMIQHRFLPNLFFLLTSAAKSACRLVDFEMFPEDGMPCGSCSFFDIDSSPPFCCRTHPFLHLIISPRPTCRNFSGSYFFLFCPPPFQKARYCSFPAPEPTSFSILLRSREGSFRLVLDPCFPR